jgi:uncharacterized protein YjbI with pentapeptide repeats
MKKPIRAPMLPPDDADLALPPADFVLDARARYENTFFHDHNFSGHETDHTVFDQCRLQEVKLSATIFDDFELNDAELKECDLANAVWNKVMIYRTEFLACRAVGLNVNEAFIKDVIFRDMNLMLSQFRFAEFKSVRFENCNLKGADFQNADLRGVVFVECDLSEAEFSFANLQNADVRGCEIKKLRANAQCLKGLIVEPFQAAYFGGLLGLQVKWTKGQL